MSDTPKLTAMDLMVAIDALKGARCFVETKNYWTMFSYSHDDQAKVLARLMAVMSQMEIPSTDIAIRHPPV